MDHRKAATYFAIAAHAGQTRQGGPGAPAQPYHVHLAEVSWILEAQGIQDPDMLAAAWLHDVLEDCPAITEGLLRRAFPDDVVDLVVDLTDVYTPERFPMLNREARKRLERERLARVSAAAQTIKAADCLSNVWSLSGLPRGFQETYLREKRELLACLKLAPEGLRAFLSRALDEAAAKVGPAVV